MNTPNKLKLIKVWRTLEIVYFVVRSYCSKACCFWRNKVNQEVMGCCFSSLFVQISDLVIYVFCYWTITIWKRRKWFYFSWKRLTPFLFISLFLCCIDHLSINNVITESFISHGYCIQSCRARCSSCFVYFLKNSEWFLVGFQNSIPCKEELDNASYGLFE